MNRNDSLERLIEDLIRKLARANVELYYLSQRVELLEKQLSPDKPQKVKKTFSFVSNTSKVN
ncbi:hypothetical protein [Bacillus sp. AK031]